MDVQSGVAKVITHLSALLFITSINVSAECFNAPGQDGAMAAQVCVPDQKNNSTGGTTGPIGSTWGSSSSGHGPYRAQNSSTPEVLSPLKFDLQSHTIKMPTIELNVQPPVEVPQNSLFNMMKDRDARWAEFDRQHAPDPRIAAGAAALYGYAAIMTVTKRLAEDATRAHFVRQQADLNVWKQKELERAEAELGKAMQDLPPSFDFGDVTPPSAFTTDKDGVIKPELIENSDMRDLRSKVRLDGQNSDVNHGQIAKLMNRILAQKAAWLPSHQVEGLRTSAALTVAASEAVAKSDFASANRLIRAAATSLDLTLGFVPGLNALNDTTQILFGLLSGQDYTGQPMATSDYLLRATGVVLGVAGPQVIRFGVFAIDRLGIALVRSTQGITNVTKTRYFWDMGRVVLNDVGAVGMGLAKVVHYRKLFPDVMKFRGMISALSPFNKEMTIAGRILSKHPQAIGFATMEEFKTVYKGNLAPHLDRLGEEFVARCLSEGKVSHGVHVTLDRAPTFDYKSANGWAARFLQSDHSLISFIRL